MQGKVSIQLIAPDKAIKQSRDLKYVFVFIIEVRILYCAASGLATNLTYFITCVRKLKLVGDEVL